MFYYLRTIEKQIIFLSNYKAIYVYIRRLLYRSINEMLNICPFYQKCKKL